MKAKKTESGAVQGARVTKARKQVASLFRDGSMYQTVARLAAGKPIEKEQWIQKAAKATKNSEENVNFMVDVLTHPNHRTNNHRVRPRGRTRKGTVQLIPCH